MSNKAVFLDRDNTLIADPGYINNPDQVKLLPGTADALISLKKMGYKLVIVTNQSAVARGIVTIKVLEQIHQKLGQLLAHKGAYIDNIYYCPYHPDGVVAKYRKDSDLRKPNPGMLLTAAVEMDIDLKQSWMIGNSYRDITAGQDAGCRTILISGLLDKKNKKPEDPVPDKEAVNIKEAANIIKMFNRTTEEQPKSETKTETSTAAVDNSPQKFKHSESINDQNDRRISKTISPPKQEVKREESIHTDSIHELLEDILKHIKSAQRENMFEEFQFMKLLAGLAQFLVVFCLILSIWFLMDHTRDITSVHTAIGYAIALQLMAIAFYIMRDRK